MSKFFVQGVLSVNSMEKFFCDLFPHPSNFRLGLSIRLSDKSFTIDADSEEDAEFIAEQLSCLCSEIIIGNRFLEQQVPPAEKPEIEEDFLPPESLPRDPHKIGLKGGNLKALDAERQELLARPISDLNLSIRARRCMLRLGINTFGDLVSKSHIDLLEGCKNFGETSLFEVREKLTEIGLKLKGD